MRLVLLAGVLGVGSLAQAAPTRVALPPAGDVGGKGSGKALDAAIRQALVLDHVPVAPAAELARAAKLARVKLKKGLPARSAGAITARGGFAGVVVYRKGKGGPFAQLVDAHGTVTLERAISVSRGAVAASDATAFADAVFGLLQGPPPAPPAQEVAEPVAPPPPTTPPPPAPAPAPSPTSEAAVAYAGPESPASAPSEDHEPAAGYYLRVGLFYGENTRLFLAPPFAYRTTKSPYPSGGISLEVFPFASFGLGVVGDFAFGLITDQLTGSTATFTSQDLRWDALLAYRWRLFSGPMGTVLMPEAGLGMRNFDVPASQNIGADDRLLVEAGLSITQPLLPHYLRLTAAALVLPLAKQSNAGQTFYGSSSSFGLQWSAELGGDIAFGLEWALAVNQERFWDSYAGPPSDTGVEVYTSYTGQLRFRL